MAKSHALTKTVAKTENGFFQTKNFSAEVLNIS